MKRGEREKRRTCLGIAVAGLFGSLYAVCDLLTKAISFIGTKLGLSVSDAYLARSIFGAKQEQLEMRMKIRIEMNHIV